MSIKIYNGYRFADSDLLTIHHKIMAFRPLVAKVQTDLMGNFLARKAEGLIDKAALKGEVAESPLSEAHSDLWDRQEKVKKTQRRDPAVDFDLSMTVLPFEERVYCTRYTDRPEINTLLREQDWIEFWGYWDNTDKDENVSDEEWDERERVWNGILKQDSMSRPSQCGFSVDFLPPTTMLHGEEVLPYVRLPEQRVREIAISELANVVFAANPNRNNSPVDAVIEATRAARKDEAGIAAKIEEILPKLPVIDLKTLLGS